MPFVYNIFHRRLLFTSIFLSAVPLRAAVESDSGGTKMRTSAASVVATRIQRAWQSRQSGIFALIAVRSQRARESLDLRRAFKVRARVRMTVRVGAFFLRAAAIFSSAAVFPSPRTLITPLGTPFRRG